MQPGCCKLYADASRMGKETMLQYGMLMRFELMP
jgi:hypothetical protein